MLTMLTCSMGAIKLIKQVKSVFVFVVWFR